MNNDINVASSNVNGIALRQASVQSTYASIWDALKRDTGSTINATKKNYFNSIINDIHETYLEIQKLNLLIQSTVQKFMI